MSAFFSALFEKIAAFAEWIGLCVVAIFKALWDFFGDFVCFVFEQILALVVTLLGAIDFDVDMFNPGSYISGLPPETINMLGYIRIGEALAIILSAIVIRFTLQLIPFVRLGS